MDDNMYSDIIARINDIISRIINIENVMEKEISNIITIDCKNRIDRNRFISFKDGEITTEDGNLLGVSVTQNIPSYNTNLIDSIIDMGKCPDELYDSVRMKAQISSKASDDYINRIEADYKTYSQQTVKIKLKGIVEVFDGGECNIGDKCINHNGIAIPSEEYNGYIVISRSSENTIEIFI